MLAALLYKLFPAQMKRIEDALSAKHTYYCSLATDKWKADHGFSSDEAKTYKARYEKLKYWWMPRLK